MWLLLETLHFLFGTPALCDVAIDLKDSSRLTLRVSVQYPVAGDHYRRAVSPGMNNLAFPIPMSKNPGFDLL